MKIKIFVSSSQTEIEKRINDFIKDKHVIDIKFSTDYDMDSGETGSFYNVLIMYEELLRIQGDIKK